MSAEYSYYNSDFSLAKKSDTNLSISSHNNWNQRESYSVELKFGKILRDNIFVISGLRFKEHFISQNNGYQFEYWIPGNIPISDNIQLGRNMTIKSIEIPLEVRKDFQYGRLTISPSFGLNLGVNLSRVQESFYSIQDSNQFIQETVFDSKIKPNQLYNFSTTSRLEIAYGVFRGNKIKLGVYHNLHLRDEIKMPDEFKSNMQSYGAQLGIEIPLLYLCDW